MAVLSVFARQSTVPLLFGKKCLSLTICRQSHVRLYRKRPGQLLTSRAKDVFNFYFVALGLLPCALVLFLSHVFFGPCELADYPTDGTIPHYWQFERTPLRQLYVKYAGPSDIEMHEMNMANEEQKGIFRRWRRIEARVKHLQGERWDYKGWYYQPFSASWVEYGNYARRRMVNQHELSQDINVIENLDVNADSSKATIINCVIDDKRRIQCLKNEHDIYLPFNAFIKSQFDVSGRMAGDKFMYYTSNERIKKPQMNKYSTVGEYGNFALYNVERRDRVECINGQYGVPMSVQWQNEPYFYPIQIAQFGLQHYSRRNLNTDMPSSLDPPKIVELPEDSVQVSLEASEKLAIISFEWEPLPTSSFSIAAENTLTKELIILKYMFSDQHSCIWRDENGFYQSLGIARTDRHIIMRDINIDISKLIRFANTGNSRQTSAKFLFRPLRLHFYNRPKWVGSISQKASAHTEMFRFSADWLVKYQRGDGGWAISVDRNFTDGRKLLESGWISAMAQGHGISVLIRAYKLFNERHYLLAANKALRVFSINSENGGVRNFVFDQPWYEEYPTAPPTLVLNGFIYSLIGLYDLSTVENSTSAAEAKDLLNSGLKSLRTLLPLYDTGSGSTYDLKHLFLKTPPNLARWDYHKVHIYLLKWLHVITNDSLFLDYSDRWLGYTVGKRAKHN